MSNLSPDTDLPDRGHARAVLAAGCLGLFGFAVSAQMLPATLVPVAETFQLDLGRRGVLLGISSIGFLSATLVGGVLGDRWGYRRNILAGLVLNVLGLAVATVARSFAHMLLFRFLLGISGGLMVGPLSALVSDAYGSRRSVALNIMTMFFNVGAVVGPFAVSLFLARGLTWRYGFGMAAGTVFLAFLVISQVLRRRRGDGEEQRASRPGPVPWSLVMILALCMLLYMGGEITFSAWSSNYIEETFGLTTDRAARVLSGFWLGMVGGRLLCVWLVPRIGYLLPILASTALCVAGGLVVALTGSAAVAFVGVCVMGFFMGGTWPNIVGYAGHRIQRRTGTVFAILVAAGSVGTLIFPPLEGALSEALDYGLRTAMMTAVLAFGLLGLIALGIRLRLGPD